MGDPGARSGVPEELREREASLVWLKSGGRCVDLVAEVDSTVMARQVGPRERKPEHGLALKSA